MSKHININTQHQTAHSRNTIEQGMQFLMHNKPREPTASSNHTTAISANSAGVWGTAHLVIGCEHAHVQGHGAHNCGATSTEETTHTILLHDPEATMHMTQASTTQQNQRQADTALPLLLPTRCTAGQMQQSDAY